jgi:hypothetical protein
VLERPADANASLPTADAISETEAPTPTSAPSSAVVPGDARFVAKGRVGLAD